MIKDGRPRALSAANKEIANWNTVLFTHLSEDLVGPYELYLIRLIYMTAR